MNLRNIREGFMTESDFPKLTSAAGKMSSAPLFIDDTPGLSILQLRARARRLWQQHGVKLFVIDYLQLLHSTARRSQVVGQLLGDQVGGVDRNGEGQAHVAAAARQDLRVDADDLAAGVEQRAAGVAGIDAASVWMNGT